MTTTDSTDTPRLRVRNAQVADIPRLVALTARIYTEEWGHSAEMLCGQMARFPEGQFVAEYGDRLVGYCATFRVAAPTALAPHTWGEITGSGFAARHDPEGDWLYRMDVCVDPDFRGLRIGRRQYAARKKLCQKLSLRGIVFGGRLPGLGKRMARYGGAQA